MTPVPANRHTVDPALWQPTPATSLEMRGIRIMRGGPQPQFLPEHEHEEIQVQTRFLMESHAKVACSSLYAPGQPHRGGWPAQCEVVVVLLSPQLMAHTADEVLLRPRFEIKPFSELRMPTVEHLCRMIRQEGQLQGGGSRFYLESVAHSMAGYLLRNHADTTPKRPPTGVFSATQLHRIEAFVDEKLGSDFGITDMAVFMELGPQRFAECFRQTCGLSPWQYVQTRRIQRAKHLLRHDRKKQLADIAVEVGFSSQSHFTNEFRRAVGVPPGVYRRQS